MLYESAECGLRDVLLYEWTLLSGLWTDVAVKEMFSSSETVRHGRSDSRTDLEGDTHTQTPAAAERTMNFSMS